MSAALKAPCAVSHRCVSVRTNDPRRNNAITGKAVIMSANPKKNILSSMQPTSDCNSRRLKPWSRVPTGAARKLKAQASGRPHQADVAGHEIFDRLGKTGNKNYIWSTRDALEHLSPLLQHVTPSTHQPIPIIHTSDDVLYDHLDKVISRMFACQVGPPAAVALLSVFSFMALSGDDMAAAVRWSILAHRAASLVDASCAFEPRMLNGACATSYYTACARASGPFSMLARRRGWYFRVAFRATMFREPCMGGFAPQQAAETLEAMAMLSSRNMLSSVHGPEVMALSEVCSRGASMLDDEELETALWALKMLGGSGYERQTKRARGALATEKDVRVFCSWAAMS